MVWKVERWGGNQNHKRRVVFIGSEDLARERWEKEHIKLRQGVVELVDDDGKTIKRSWAPRARTRLA